LLQIKRVELQGFKSFCDRTELKFNGSGIAAVVGPNGCGKSNLSDAISWVLGEQSAKLLRGARMEDVIFAGTRDRKPLGLAQVTLTLVDPNFVEAPVTDQAALAQASAEPAEAGDHTNGHANGHHNGHSHLPLSKTREITVTRRLYRSGDSEYLINGKVARLRDIQDIFMGTGLGPESYAIIEQGRIGQILSTKPQERRAVIEEAAGVSKFKTRRRLAEAKLESAKQNLNRVFDILEEVGRQANSLKRQAAKAKRYDELKTEYTALLKQALAGKFRMMERDAARTALDLNAASGELSTVTAQVAEQEAQDTALREQCFALEAQLTEARQKLAELRVEAERTRGRLESQTRQAAAIAERQTQADRDAAAIAGQLEQRAAEFEAQQVETARLDEETGEARTLFASRTQERDQFQNSLRQREMAIEGSRQQVLRLLGEASSLKNQLAQIDTYLAAVERDMERCRKEEEISAADLERLDKVKAEVQERLSARQLELQSLAEQRSTIESGLQQRRTEAGQTRQGLEKARGELSRLKARRDSLEEIISHRSYTTESVKRLFTAIDKGSAEGLKPLGVLADFVEVDAAYEKATEEFLHDELEYVVVETFEQAERGIELMRTNLDGRATFLVHPDPSVALGGNLVSEPPIGPETGILCRLSDALRLTNGLTNAPVELLPRLARCYLAADRAAAHRLSLQYPDVYFLLPDGICYHGFAVSGGRKTGSGPLALKRELRELSSKVKASQTEVDVAAERLSRLETELAALAEHLEKLRTEQQAQEKDSLALTHENRKLIEEHNRASSRLSVARLDLERLNREVEKSREKRQGLLAAIEEKEQARMAQEEGLAGARSELDQHRAQAARAAEEHAALRASLASLEERQRSARVAAQRLGDQVRELNGRRERLSGEMERMGFERQRLETENAELTVRAGEQASAIQVSDETVAGLAAREEEARQGLAQVEETVKAARVLASATQEKRSQIELDLVRKQSELKFLDETSRKELHLPVEEIAQGEETVPDDEALAAIEHKCGEIRGRIEALGAVNTQALEEYQEAQQRYDFLNEQRQDLLDSIRDTEKAIQEIDVESKKRFVEAFEAINANFRDMFRVLFNGGIGEMRLTDETNAMDSGIDIVAQPPGKKLQNVLLLSGGERALTAMSLLMAIFKYQPSPFCILDEVDAPLDEPNILRLTRLLGEMSRQTQFIVITHAKRTMEASQVLYGVTMPEPGVSKLVSVKFQAPPPPPPVFEAVAHA